MLMQARHWLEVGKPERCLEELDRLGTDALTAEGFFLRAAACISLERWEDAVTAGRRGLDKDPADLDLIYALALSVEEVGDEVEAEHLFLRGLTEQPYNVRFLTGYANLLSRFHQLDKAGRLLDRAAGAGPEAIEVDLSRMQLEFARGSTRKATVWAKRALEKDPENLSALQFAGMLDSLRGRSASGSRQLRTVASQRLGNRDVATAARSTTIESHFLMWPVRVVRRIPLPWQLFWPVAVMLVVLPIAFVADLVGAPSGVVTGVIIVGPAFVVYFWIAVLVAHLILKRRNR